MVNKVEVETRVKGGGKGGKDAERKAGDEGTYVVSEFGEII